MESIPILVFLVHHVLHLLFFFILAFKLDTTVMTTCCMATLPGLETAAASIRTLTALAWMELTLAFLGIHHLRLGKH